MGYSGKGLGKRGDRIKDPSILVHTLKHERLGFGAKDEKVECSRLYEALRILCKNYTTHAL